MGWLEQAASAAGSVAQGTADTVVSAGEQIVDAATGAASNAESAAEDTADTTTQIVVTIVEAAVGIAASVGNETATQAQAAAEQKAACSKVVAVVAAVVIVAVAVVVAAFTFGAGAALVALAVIAAAAIIGGAVAATAAAAIFGASLAAAASALFTSAAQSANLALTYKDAAERTRARQVALDKLLSAIRLILSTAQQSPPLKLESPDPVDRATVLLQRLIVLLRRQPTNKRLQIVLPRLDALAQALMTASARLRAQRAVAAVPAPGSLSGGTTPTIGTTAPTGFPLK